jgi:hypothetical protein
MALVICEQGPLSSDLTDALLSTGRRVATARPDDDDLFSQALGHEVIVYAPAPSLLAGTLEPRPSRERMRRVLRAARAPGVESVVLVAPARGGFAAEERLLRHSGTPFVLLRSPPLLDEIVEQMGTRGVQALWVPSAGNAPITDGARLAAAIRDAVETENHGTTVLVPGEHLDAPTLFGRAASLFASGGAKPRLHVHGVWPPLYRATRQILRLLGRPEPAALTLWDQLRRQTAEPATP